jgi:hypothetical protein
VNLRDSLILTDCALSDLEFKALHHLVFHVSQDLRRYQFSCLLEPYVSDDVGKLGCDTLVVLRCNAKRLVKKKFLLIV